MKCALDCVHGCLGKCSRVYSKDGVGPSRSCYTECTQKCLPSCTGDSVEDSDALGEYPALADAIAGPLEMIGKAAGRV